MAISNLTQKAISNNGTKATKRDPLIRDRRAAPPTLADVERGIATLRILDLVRYATNDQLQTTFEERTKTGRIRQAAGTEFAANRALRQLFDGGWIDRIPVHIPREAYRRHEEGTKESFVNILTKKGLEALGRHMADQESFYTRYKIDQKPRKYRPFIHPYGVADWYFTARKAVRARGWHFTEWMDDRELAARKEAGFGFINVPDGFFIIDNPDAPQVYPHFVEIDLGTETVESDEPVAARGKKKLDWVSKIRGFGAYLPNAYHDDFLDLPDPVVLIVTTDDGRATNILAAIKKGGGGGRYWVTTFEALHQEGFMGYI